MRATLAINRLNTTQNGQTQILKKKTVVVGYRLIQTSHLEVLLKLYEHVKMWSRKFYRYHLPLSQMITIIDFTEKLNFPHRLHSKFMTNFKIATFQNSFKILRISM